MSTSTLCQGSLVSTRCMKEILTKEASERLTETDLTFRIIFSEIYNFFLEMIRSECLSEHIIERPVMI